MVNSEEFVKRLQLVMDHYELSASALAESIGVQRSSISHLLSGRNKPSLDFIMKMLSVYKEVDLYWLLNGKGQFPKTTSSKNQAELGKAIKMHSQVTENSEIERIVIFFKDGSFKSYNK